MPDQWGESELCLPQGCVVDSGLSAERPKPANNSTVTVDFQETTQTARGGEHRTERAAEDYSMSFVSGQPAKSPALLKLYNPAEAHGHEIDSSGVLSPSMQLPDFFEHWFLPIVLIDATDASPGTVQIYRDSLAWWQRLTQAPTLRQIDEFRVASFNAGLKTATYTRGKFGLPRPLRLATANKYQRCIKAILSRLGRGTPQRPGKEILRTTPLLTIHRPPQPRVKRAFTLAEARRIVAACEEASHWKRRPGRPPAHPAALAAYERDPVAWHQAALGLLFYLGVRSGTALRVEWQMLQRDDDWFAFDLPAEIVEKTGKGLRRPVPASLLRALERLAGESLASVVERQRSGLILPWPHCYEHFATCHDRLQAAAGIPPERWLSPQAWRRTNAQQLGLVGAKAAVKVARQGLDHADESTTTGSYVDVAVYFMMLPDILPERVDHDQMLLF